MAPPLGSGRPLRENVVQDLSMPWAAELMPARPVTAMAVMVVTLILTFVVGVVCVWSSVGLSGRQVKGSSGSGDNSGSCEGG